jgi:MAX-binding protein
MQADSKQNVCLKTAQQQQPCVASSSSNSSPVRMSAAATAAATIEDARRDKALHNTLEKNRRAHLKECFENLQIELPQYKDKKATNLCILNYTVKYLEVDF